MARSPENNYDDYDNPEESLDQGKDDASQDKDKQLEALREKLSNAEYNAVKDGRTTTEELAAQRNQLANDTERQMNNMIAEDHLSPVMEAEIKDKLAAATSPEKVRLVQAELAELKEKAKEEDPEAPELLALQDKFEKICDKNVKYIGTKELQGFKEWMKQERKKKPTIAHLEEQVKRLSGEIQDKNGLAPRKKFFNENLAPMYKKYGMPSPLDSDYIAREGLSERKEYLANAEELEKHLDQVRKLGLYSEKTVRTEMQTMLTAKSPHEQRQTIDFAKKCAKVEQENFTHLSTYTNIGPHRFQAMSDRSRDFLLADHRDQAIDEGRMQRAQMWPGGIKWLQGLAKEMEEILENHPEMLDKAAATFQNLSDDGKMKMVAEYKTLTKNQEKNEEIEAPTYFKTAINEIDQTEKRGYICSKTAERFRENFVEDKFKDKSTGRFKVDVLGQKVQDLTKAAPVTTQNKRNLAAYMQAHKDFEGSLKQLRKVNPEASDDEIKKWQEEYENMTWDKKKKHQQKLNAQINDLRKEKEVVENVPEANQKPASIESINNGFDWHKLNEMELKEEFDEALQMLGQEYANILANPDQHSDFHRTQVLAKITYFETMRKAKLERDGASTINPESAKEIVSDMEDVLDDDAQVKRVVRDQQTTTVGIELVEQSQRRHAGKVDAKSRAAKETMQHTPDGSTEAELKQAFIDQSNDQGDNVVLDEEGTGKDVTTISLDGFAGMTKEYGDDLRQKVYQERGKAATQKGEASFELEDYNSGQKTIDAEKAKKLQEGELEEATDMLVDKVDNKGFDLNERITARREARRLIDERRNEKMDSAA